MDFMVWAIAGGAAVVLIPIAFYFAPAHTTIIVDTPTSTARAEMRLLWGMGPVIIARALPSKGNGSPLAVFNDPLRIGHALMTPGIADAAGTAVRSLYALRPRVAQLRLAINLNDTAQSRVVETAVHAALALAPASLRERIVVSRGEAPGAELGAEFALSASPAQLNLIYRRFKNSRAAQEFRRRLKKKSRPDKKGARQVQVS